MATHISRVPTSRRAALAGGAALVLSAAAAHAVSAQQAAAGIATSDPTTPTVSGASDVFFFSAPGAPPTRLDQQRDDWLSALASTLGVSIDQLKQAIEETNKAVGLPPPLLLGPPGKLGAGPGRFSLHVESPFASAANALGISEDQLHKELATGKSLTDISRAHHLDPTIVADAIKAQRRSEIDQAAASGVMPKATADRIKANINDEVVHVMQAVPTVNGERGVSIHLEWSPAP